MEECIICGGRCFPFHENFLKCENCGLYTNNNYSSQENLKNMLKNNMLTASRNKVVENRRLGRAKTQIEVINNYSKKGKVFDVAAAGGFFMKVAQDDGWVVDGNEISQASVNWAKQNYNLDIRNNYFEELDLPNDFDVIVFWNTLEHMHKPVESLKKAYEILKRDGLIYIRVPNRDDNNLAKYLERLHSFEFNVRNLDKLLEDNGFSKIFIKTNTDDAEAMDLLYKKI